MPDHGLRIYFDFVDPLSYLVWRSADRAREGDSVWSPDDVEWVGFELRPPPAPLTSIDDPLWADRWTAARAWSRELDVPLAPPSLVPWSRKAHELHVHAGTLGGAGRVRAAIFDAYFAGGRDIGRVDVLVDVAVAVGLDRTEIKAVLDVDRYQTAVVAARRAAEAHGVADVPAYSLGEGPVRAFPDPADLGTLLPDP